MTVTHIGTMRSLMELVQDAKRIAAERPELLGHSLGALEAAVGELLAVAPTAPTA